MTMKEGAANALLITVIPKVYPVERQMMGALGCGERNYVQEHEYINVWETIPIQTQPQYMQFHFIEFMKTTKCNTISIQFQWSWFKYRDSNKLVKIGIIPNFVYRHYTENVKQKLQNKWVKSWQWLFSPEKRLGWLGPLIQSNDVLFYRRSPQHGEI